MFIWRYLLDFYLEAVPYTSLESRGDIQAGAIESETLQDETGVRQRRWDRRWDKETRSVDYVPGLLDWEGQGEATSKGAASVGEGKSGVCGVHARQGKHWGWLWWVFGLLCVISRVRIIRAKNRPSRLALWRSLETLSRAVLLQWWGSKATGVVTVGGENTEIMSMDSILVVLQWNRTNRMYIYRERERFILRNWCTWYGDWQARRLETQGRAAVGVQGWRWSAGRIPSSSCLFLLRPSADKGGPPTLQQVSKSTDLNVNLIF